MCRRSLAVTVAGAALLAGSVAVRGQEPAREGVFSDRSEVASVLVPITVRDARGRLVHTLERESFRLFVDGMEFPIVSFWREAGLPLALSFVVDTSGSMGRRRLAMAQQAVGEFVAQLGPRDEACLITFGAGEVKRRVAFGADPRAIPRVLASLEGFGTTALYDMLGLAPQAMEGAHNVRRAVLLFTDGVDTASQLSVGEAQEALEGLADPLYAFGIEPPPRGDEAGPSYAELLRTLAGASGGRYIPVERVELLPAAARELRRELTMRYIVSFETSGLGQMKWRRLEVRVSGPFTATAREGYRGTLP